MGLQGYQETFAQQVSSLTGLSLRTVRDWVTAEGGPPGNPLNIGPGRNYGSPQAAAQATAELLRNPRYAPVLASSGGSVAQQLAAIAASPWDAGHYRGAGAPPTTPPGTLLRGVDSRLYGTSAGKTQGGDGPSISDYTPGSTTPQDASLLGGLTNPLGAAETWAEGVAGKALAYVSLTMLAVVLLILGLLQILGVSPRSAAGATIGKGV